MSDMKLPWMHEEMRMYTKVLADEDYHYRIWVCGDTPSSRVTFDTIIHFYFDDTSLSENPEKCIGWFLRNQSEAQAVRPVVEAIDVVLDECEGTATDADYVRAPHWPQVVAAARALLAIMNAPDEGGASAP